MIGNAIREIVTMFPGIAIRELVANMLVHQDLAVTGAGPMVEIFADRIEISNPGESLVATDRPMRRLSPSRTSKSPPPMVSPTAFSCILLPEPIPVS